jgi:hypothetical protein
MLLKRKGDNRYVVGGRWAMQNRVQRLGPGDENLPTAGACQHHPLNLSCSSRKPTNLEPEFVS